MGKGYTNDPKKDSYKKTKFSREKNLVFSEEDQEYNDQRLAAAQENRSKERTTNIAKALSKPPSKEDETNTNETIKSSEKDYAVSNHIPLTEEDDE